jgi:ABC-type Zn2+ transport system substrate-binding protein/surface adhesin
MFEVVGKFTNASLVMSDILELAPGILANLHMEQCHEDHGDEHEDEHDDHDDHDHRRRRREIETPADLLTLLKATINEDGDNSTWSMADVDHVLEELRGDVSAASLPAACANATALISALRA